MITHSAIETTLMKKIAFLFGLFITQLYSSGQTTTSPIQPNIPELMPASPEPTGFLRQTLGTVNLSTGGLATSIPIYTIKMANFSFPISLSYSTQGLKSTDPGTRVGLGWSLVANGVITRTIRGVADELVPQRRLPAALDRYIESPETEPYGGTINNDYNYDFLNGASVSQPSFDTQPDEYNFSVNGYTGKFIVDSNGVARVTSTQNCKIVQIGGLLGGFVLTAPDGVRYRFGEHKEITIDFNVKGFSASHDRLVTSFFLDRIDLLNGDYVNFMYGGITTQYRIGVTQSLALSQDTRNECSPGGYGFSSDYYNKESYVKYQTYYLAGINTSTGESIDLSYVSRPDQSGDNRLKSITISSTGVSYKFQYYDVPAQSGSAPFNGRFVLTNVRKQYTQILNDNINFVDSSLSYQLSYNKLSDLRPPSGLTQDFMGFYKSGVSSLVPQSLTSADTALPNRTPDYDNTVTGTLSEIKYPTGGYERYFYEQNKSSEWHDTQPQNKSVSASVQSVMGPYPTYSVYFNPNFDHVGSIIGAAQSTNGSVSDSAHCIFIINLYEDGVQKYSRCAVGYNTESFDVNLKAGSNYKLEIVFRTSYLNGYANINYFQKVTPFIVNIPSYGLRVRKVEQYDPITNSPVRKFYTYGNLQYLDFSTLIAPAPVFKNVIDGKSQCGLYGFDPLYKYYTTTTFHSNSINNIYEINEGNPIFYKSILESSDSVFSTGGKEYTFYPPDNGQRTDVLMGQTPISVPMGQAPTLFGKTNRTVIFNANMDTVSVDTNNYDHLIDMSHYVPSCLINRRLYSNYSDIARMGDFDIVKIYYSNNWIRPGSKITTSFQENKRLYDTLTYAYVDFRNVLPNGVIASNSNGDIIKNYTRYATDYPLDTTAAKMIANNQIEAPLQDSILRNNTLIKFTKTDYKDWQGNGTLLLPQIISSKESATDELTTKVTFDRYDNSGNLLEAHKWTDAGNTVYLWDTLHHLPVCEFKNASYNEIAYCGFESGEQNGNWTVQSGNAVQLNTPFGIMGFSGQLSKTISTPGVYVITVWTNQTATVNGFAGVLKKSVAGWGLYEWKITDPATITVSGTNIDDVKLFPARSRPTSYTYYPFIGVHTITDATNTVVIYQYDGLGRLVLVRDDQDNIVKKICYNYAGQQTDCGVALNNAPQWTPTGNIRCVKNASNQNTGYQEQEEKDNNIASGTYNQTRWVLSTYNTTACPLPVFYNAAKLQVFTKNDCPANYAGSIVTYNVAAGTYSSNISQADADQKAINDINVNGQNYANANGTCTAQGRWIVVSCIYKKVLIDGLYQWRYEITRKYCENGVLGTDSSIEYSTSAVPVESCSVGPV